MRVYSFYRSEKNNKNWLYQIAFSRLDEKNMLLVGINAFNGKLNTKAVIET